jgi:hypothetical protein
VDGIEMHHHVARQFAWCKTGVPAPSAGEVAALLYDLDEARATIEQLRDRDKLREMARVIDGVIAHYHEYDLLDEEWLVETARQLRKLAG